MYPHLQEIFQENLHVWNTQVKKQSLTPEKIQQKRSDILAYMTMAEQAKNENEKNMIYGIAAYQGSFIAAYKAATIIFKQIKDENHDLKNPSSNFLSVLTLLQRCFTYANYPVDDLLDGDYLKKRYPNQTTQNITELHINQALLLLEKLFFKFNKEELKLNLKNTLEKLKESAHVPLFQFLAAKRLCELGEYISAILFLDATFSCLSITPAMPPNAAHLISEQGLGIFKYCLKHLNDEEKENLRFHVNTLAILDGETHDQLYSSISDKTL